MTIEERLSAIEETLNRLHYKESKVALLVSERTYHAIIDLVLELENGGKKNDMEEQYE